MNINGIESRYFYNNQNGVSKVVSPFSAPFNPIFDEVIFSKTPDLLVAEKNEINKSEINVVSHRGYTKTAPENTIPAFIMAAKAGYDTVECDIEWTKDGIPVILHDSTINRTARKENGGRLFWPRKCSNLTYEELLQYDFGSWYSDDFKGTKIPKFNELLDCANDYDLNLYIELKETANFDANKAKMLSEVVKDAGLEGKVTWISFNEDYLKLMADNAPDARLGYLSKKKVNNKTINVLKSLQTGKNEVFLDLKASKVSENSSKILKEARFNFEVWGQDDSNNLEELLSYGCKGITTDKITREDIKNNF